MAELLLSLGASTASRDAHGRTIGHVCCATNDVTAARMLTRMGVNFDEKDEGGRSPLMTAVWSCAVNVAHYLLDVITVDPNAVDDQVENLRHFLKATVRQLGATIPQRSFQNEISPIVRPFLLLFRIFQGASALSVAAQLGHRELVVLLLRFGADPALRDEMGRTALDVAQLSGHEHIRCILQVCPTFSV